MGFVVFFYAALLLATAGISFAIDFLIVANTKITKRVLYVFMVNLLMSVLTPFNFLLIMSEATVFFVVFVFNRLIVRSLIKTFFYSKISLASKRKIWVASLISEAIVGAIVGVIVFFVMHSYF